MQKAKWLSEEPYKELRKEVKDKREKERNTHLNAEFQRIATRDNSTQGHHQLVNNKIRLIMFFAAKDGEALYSHQK